MWGSAPSRSQRRRIRCLSWRVFCRITSTSHSWYFIYRLLFLVSGKFISFRIIPQSTFHDHKCQETVTEIKLWVVCQGHRLNWNQTTLAFIDRLPSFFLTDHLTRDNTHSIFIIKEKKKSFLVIYSNKWRVSISRYECGGKKPWES